MWRGHVAFLGFSSEIGFLDLRFVVAISGVGSDEGDLDMFLPIIIPQHPPDGGDAAEGVGNPFGPTPGEGPGCATAPMLQDDGNVVCPVDPGDSPLPDAADKFALVEPKAAHKVVDSDGQLGPSTHACI